MDWTKPIYTNEEDGYLCIPECCGSCGEADGFYFKNETDGLTCVNCGDSGYQVMNIKRTTKPNEQKKLFDEKKEEVEKDVSETFNQNIKDLEISIDKSLKIVDDVKSRRKENQK